MRLSLGSLRVRLAALIGLAALLIACASTASMGAAGVQAASGDQAEAQEICANVENVWLQRMANAYRPDWSGDLQMLPAYPNPVDGGLSHAGPWDHLQDVPLVLWGPGYVKPGRHFEDVSITDLAPTTAALLKFPFEVPDGSALTQALVPEADRPIPKLVVTLVWDSAGLNVLGEHPTAWPYLRSFAKQGAWFDNATVGISNSNTPPGHAAIGTGAFPSTSGIIDEFIRIHGALDHPGEGGPGLMLWPTLADIYDLAYDNEPIVGGVATLAAHQMMVSHGSMWHGGDRDISIMRQEVDAETGGAEAVEWNLPGAQRLYFTFPEYANEVSVIDPFNRELDQADGALDGLWRGHDIEALRGGFDAPSRTPYQTQLIKEVVKREHFGQDEVPDLLFLNYKAIDTTGHAYGLDSPEMWDTVAYQDRALKELVPFLNAEVGKGAWVMLLTADHGAQYPADAVGGIPIDPNRVRDALYATFDADDDDVELFQVVRPTQLWVDHAELEDNGFTVEDIAAFFEALTAAEVARTDFTLSPGQEDELVYETAFPSRLFGEMSCLPVGRGS